MAGRSPEQAPEDVAPDVRPLPPLPIASAVFLGLLVALCFLVLGWGWVPEAAFPANPGPTKWMASPLCALAVAVFFLATASRRSLSDARWSALVLALGTPFWSLSQELGGPVFAIVSISAAVFCAVRSEEDPRWSDRAGLPLALAAAAQPADLALCAAFAFGLMAHRPRRAHRLLLWSLPGAILFLHYGQSLGFRPPQHLALLFSPVDGLLPLAPVVVVAGVGMIAAARRGERVLASILGGSVLARWAFSGLVVGGSPIEALPLLLLFLADGVGVVGGLGAVVAVLSVAMQVSIALGDGPRWRRLHAGARWDPLASPLAQVVQERALLFGLPGIQEGKPVVRMSSLVLFAPEGSRIAFDGPRPNVTGAEPLFSHVRATGGARLEGGRLRVAREGGIFLRIGSRARARRFELRIVGKSQGEGKLLVAESTFWTAVPRQSVNHVTGAFRVRHPYFYPESGGSEVTITAVGAIELESITLAAPGDPWDPLRLPGS